MHLERADIILLLISADFIASDYCYSIEMMRALERHDAGEARVIPIILRPTYWQETPFSKLQVLPTEGKPVMKWRDRDDAFLDIAEGIRKAIEELSPTSSGGSAGSSLVWYIPHRHNLYFTGREDVLKSLHDTLTTKEATALNLPVAINGLGGIGKTQTAVEYVYRYRDEYRYVFWVRANTLEELASDFAAIASLLNLHQQNAQDQNVIVTAIKRWLEVHTDWLLILDSADDLEMARDFIPPAGKGHVLLTTRAQAVKPLAQSIEI